MVIVAHVNYLSIVGENRYGVNELARRMAKPRNMDYRQLIHSGRYIRGKSCGVNKSYQKNWKIIAVRSDTVRAGCLETGKSTNGGVIMFGIHIIKHWSSTQSLIALSSGEAEYYGFVRAGSHASGQGGCYLI